MSKNVKFDYNEINELSGQEILEKMRNGELKAVPKDERPDFLKFAKMEPGSPERQEFLKNHYSGENDVDDPAEPAPDTIPNEDEDNSGIGNAADSIENEPDNDKSTPEGEQDKHDPQNELLSELAKKEEIINNFRSKEGKRGKELQEANKKIETLNQKLQELQKDSKPDIPDVPEYPDPDNFDEGLLDPEYNQAIKKYRNDMIEFTKNIQTAKPDLSEFQEKISSLDEFINSERKTRKEKEFDNSWSDLWETTANFQSNYGLETKQPIKRINDYWLKMIAPQGTISDEERSSAKKWCENLSENDKNAYLKVVPAINAIYGFDEDNKPFKRYQNQQAALLEAGIADKYISKKDPVKPSEKERVEAIQKKQLEKDNAANGLNSNDLGGSDGLLSEPNTREEKENRLRDLLAIRKKDVAAFKKSSFAKEYDDLLNSLGYKGLRVA